MRKTPISSDEFVRLREVFFLGANGPVRELGLRLMDHCWLLDNYAVTQQWEGQDERLIVFGVPYEKRRNVHIKNYFSVWRNNDRECDYLSCEVIVPKPNQTRFLAENNFSNRLFISTLPQVTGHFQAGDFDRVVPLITKAYNFRVKEEFQLTNIK